ncbi:hypothetical protein LCGC14_0411840 [marine sediment metagenome]|uniref:Uncharacterized protein n=1 Tax=marine sediment metagenome TaxID=412755 RepID=A0A0F9TBN4_9ZZZZ
MHLTSSSKENIREHAMRYTRTDESRRAIRRDAQEYTQVRRQAILSILGSKCSCVGDDCWHSGDCVTSDPRCLQLDHVNGDGAADRKRIGGGSNTVSYYFNHLSEAAEKLQILCANCNWIKCVRDGEIPKGKDDGNNGYRAAVVVSRVAPVSVRIEGLSSYRSLVKSFRRLADSIIGEGEVNLFKTLERWGIVETPRHPMSYHLARSWSRQDFYSGSDEDLTLFLGEKRVLMDGTAKILDKRIREASKEGEQRQWPN